MELTFSLMKGRQISPFSVSLLPAMSLYEGMNLKSGSRLYSHEAGSLREYSQWEGNGWNPLSLSPPVNSRVTSFIFLDNRK